MQANPNVTSLSKSQDCKPVVSQVYNCLKVRIDRVLPLSEAQAAHRLVEERAPIAGKIVLTP
jgi:hypothetical protein